MPGSAAGYGFDLSGVGLRLAGECAPLLRRLADDWRPYRDDAVTDPLLDCRIAAGPSVAPEGPFDPKGMTASYDAGGAFFTMPEGTAEVASGEPATVVVHTLEDESRAYFAMRNLVRACLAWRMPDRDGLMLHSAGVVRGGRAFVLVGAAGSGKSTWSRIACEAGAGMLSEDVVLVQREGDGAVALGAPFRIPHGLQPLRGRFPLAAILLPAHGETPGLDAVPSERLRTTLVANLPFLVEALEVDERPLATVERLLEAAPAYRLTFRPDDSFLPLLDGI